MKQLILKKREIMKATFCSAFSWIAIIVGFMGFFVLEGYGAVCAGVMIAAGIVMFYGMNILRKKCCCPNCHTGSGGMAKDREYIGMLSAKKDFVVCPNCHKRISIK